MAAAIKRSSERGQEDGAPAPKKFTVSNTSPRGKQKGTTCKMK